MSVFSNAARSMPNSLARERVYDTAACADSCMISPSCPVSSSAPLPCISVTSTGITSPPASVHAKDVARRPQVTVHGFGRHAAAVRFRLGYLPGRLAADVGDLALQVAHPGFVGVFAHDTANRVVGDVELLRLQAVLFQ